MNTHKQFCEALTNQTHLDRLPRINCRRWTANRKAMIIRALITEEVSIGYCLNAYRLTVEELDQWAATYLTKGIDGLKATKIQLYRGNRGFHI